jgi:hypothetical protein
MLCVYKRKRVLLYEIFRGMWDSVLACASLHIYYCRYCNKQVFLLHGLVRTQAQVHT